MKIVIALLVLNLLASALSLNGQFQANKSAENLNRISDDVHSLRVTLEQEIRLFNDAMDKSRRNTPGWAQ
jgi:hypothetical protein